MGLAVTAELGANEGTFTARLKRCNGLCSLGDEVRLEHWWVDAGH